MNRRRLGLYRLILLTLAVSSGATGVAFSQEPATRAEADRKVREEKAAQTKPYEPNRLERALALAERRSFFVADREGLYPKLGSLTVGSGFAYGVGFRNRRLFEHQGALDLWGAASIRRYGAVEARLMFPRLAANHLHLETWVGRRDYPQEDFYGLGPDSNRGDQSDYAIRTNRFRRSCRRQARGPGAGGRRARIPAAATRQREGRSISERDRRVQPCRAARHRQPSQFPAFGRVRRSGLSRAAECPARRLVSCRPVSHYDDRTTGHYTFNRVDADLRQFIGVSRRAPRHCRCAPSSRRRTTSDGQAVPFYLCRRSAATTRCADSASIGSAGRTRSCSRANTAGRSGAGSTRRSSTMPARSRTVVAISISTDLEQDYGFGFRFNTNNGVVFRVDAALREP